MSNQIVPLSSLSVNGKGTYGIAASAVPYAKDKYTYLRITDINDDGTLNLDDLKSVDDPEACNYVLQPNDIVFARTGASTGRNYFYDGSDGTFVYAGFLIKFSIDPNKVNPLYVKYFCQSQKYRDWIYSFNIGSTRGNINERTLAQMPIELPSRRQQDLLVENLSKSDAKIKLNNQINRNLEEQAQAIFKSWFVDFEPFDGEMPKDWSIGKLSDIAEYEKEKISLSELTEETYYSTENMLSNKTGVTSATNLPTIKQTTRCFSGETIISNIRPYFKKIFYCTEDSAGCSTDVLCFKPKNKLLATYNYNLLYSDNFFDYMVKGSKGTKMPRGDKSQIMNYEICIPSDEYIQKFDGIVSKLQMQIQNLKKETTQLTKTRDALLPELMSGDLGC